MLDVALSEQLRSRFCQLLAATLMLAAVLGTLLNGVGGFIVISTTRYTEIVEGYDGQAFILLLVTGVLVTLTHFFGAMFLFMMSDPARRTDRLIILMHAFTFAILIAMVLEIIGGILCFSHISHLQDYFNERITIGMGQYASQPQVKHDVDRLQMDFQCCGNDGYQDWFKTQWHNPQSTEIGHSPIPAADSVPFSCCDRVADRDCITAAIHQNERHSNYDYKSDLTVYKVGCREALVDYFGDQVLVTCGSITIALCGFEIIVVILVRYLQTSVAAAIELGDATATTFGYLCGCGKSDDEILLPSQSAINRSILLDPADIGDGALSVYGSSHDIMSPNLPDKKITDDMGDGALSIYGSVRDMGASIAGNRHPSLFPGVHARLSRFSQSFRGSSVVPGYQSLGPHDPRSTSSVESVHSDMEEDDRGLYSTVTSPGFTGRNPGSPPRGPLPPLPNY